MNARHDRKLPAILTELEALVSNSGLRVALKPGLSPAKLAAFERKLPFAIPPPVRTVTIGRTERD